MATWLDRLINRQRAGPKHSTARTATAPQSESRAWLVRPLGPSDRPEPGTQFAVSARADVRVGHRCLVLTGSKVVAIGVVLGETAGARGTQAVRTLLVTHRLRQPFEITRSLGRARAAPTTSDEWEAVRDAGVHGWDFVTSASEALDSGSRQLSPKTLERHAEEFLIKVLNGVECLYAERQVALPGTEDPDVMRPRPLRADIVVTWSDNGEAHVLVIEGEWTQPGGAQSAAQAYEYAHHIQNVDDGEAPVGFGAFPFHEAAVHAVVVANRCPGKCLTAETLGVRRFTYAQFVTFIARKEFVRLPTIRQ